MSVINISDNEEIDHCHKSNDDKEDDDGVSIVVEMKPVIAPLGGVVKVEKDW